jgi:phospholipase C
VVSGFPRFQSDAANGTLAAFSYIEPEWATHPRPTHHPGGPQGGGDHNFLVENDQHPVSNLAVGEKLLYDVYQALRNGPAWGNTLLIITYDEHGGNYDHVHPPTGAIAPDSVIGPSGFDFTRFGVRVPAVLVSPLIPAGTILHAPGGGQPPFDHTSIIATIRTRFGIGALGRRDAAAPDVGSIVTLPAPRTDDPLAAVEPPTSADPVLVAGSPPVGAAPSSFLEANALAAAALPVPTDPIADPEAKVKTLKSAADQYNFIQERRAAWRAAGRPSA